MANETRVTAPIAPRSGRGAYTAIRTAPVTSNATATRHSTRTAGRGAQARNIARLRCRDGGQAWPDVIAFDAAAFIRPPPRTGLPATALRAARPVHAPAPAMPRLRRARSPRRGRRRGAGGARLRPAPGRPA